MTDFESGNIEAIIKEKGEVITCTSGTSMLPMLRDKRDMVVIVLPERNPKLNDVVLYRASCGKLLLHRIIKVLPDEYIIRGDNRYAREFGVKESDIIGILKEFYRGGKRIDCEKNSGYKFYVFFNRISYPIRHLWVKIIKRFLAKLKHLVIK